MRLVGVDVPVQAEFRPADPVAGIIIYPVDVRPPEFEGFVSHGKLVVYPPLRDGK